MPCVLVVAMADSIHTARWVRLALGQGMRIVLLPVTGGALVPELADARPIRDTRDLDGLSDRQPGLFVVDALDREAVAAFDRGIGYRPWRPSWLPPSVPILRAGQLAAAIERLAPDVVHSMEIQLAGYACLAVRQALGPAMPPWMLSNWGSDVYLYRKIGSHRSRLEALVGLVDVYVAECARDIAIFRATGFRGRVVPPIPASGGMDLDGFPEPAELGLPSGRGEIVVKGYHGWAGRGLHVLAAIHLAADALRRYAIRITLASPEVRAMAAVMAGRDRLDIVCESRIDSHRLALLRLARARIVVGSGISDGITTTLLEAMTTGVFPILATTSCADEWIEDGRTGLLASPHDTAALAAALTRAAGDDALVDQAAIANRATVAQRWNARTNAPVIAANYRRAMAVRDRVGSPR
ncbi:glycosyltransferase involved in cell wall biosynthesis [Stella humosa]|uniref:Glycosyltransferase involved in cell wall biosynthesis n=1 Tax=Stella humosa TaxID=94 RepID=A0A3N1LH72_9PROT|nr:glycosyltransferase [Stella humosa]ROP90574.1 glycosyltransferase involved in cell wall biosynthesis [Stella humosa]BBK29531.1 hypothetical protein STHU_01650 [Stella humosa]